MGYHALPSHQSEDGLHDIDMALLPQKNLRHKVAVEADGWSHYLYEDFGMDSAVKPATRCATLIGFATCVMPDQIIC